MKYVIFIQGRETNRFLQIPFFQLLHPGVAYKAIYFHERNFQIPNRGMYISRKFYLLAG